jgi:hypothetical protein
VLPLIRKLFGSTSGWLGMLLAAVSSLLKTRAALQLENVALRHQIGVLQRSVKKRPRLTASDRLLWVWLSRVFADWRSALVIVKPETVLAWHIHSLVSVDFFTVPTIRFQVLYGVLCPSPRKGSIQTHAAGTML